MDSVREWADRIEALIRQAHADGVQWLYEPDYCYSDGCSGCCQFYGPLTASRGVVGAEDFEYAQIII